MKIYTRTGDLGETGLLSGERVPKNNSRIKAYGEVDELNSVIGTVSAALPDSIDDDTVGLRGVQEVLFLIGSHLAVTSGSTFLDRLQPVTDELIQGLESRIDRMEGGLPELKLFILPGGHMAGALSHVARTVCRRVERTVLDLAAVTGNTEDLKMILAYLNRLSDYFFVLARFINHETGHGDVVQSG